jgi:hypothetical protein
MLFAALVGLVFSPALLAQPPQRPNGLPDLVGALKATPGCLGVEAARTQGGKQVIFAWFENRKAALNWYNSDVHRGLMQPFGGGGRPDGPMADVPENVPVLAVASLTLNTAAQTAAEMKNQLSQIAIELYTPLPGGLAVGGRFAPTTLKVPGLVDIPVSALKPQ